MVVVGKRVIREWNGILRRSLHEGTYLLIFRMIVFSRLKSGRSSGSSAQHLTMMLLTSS